MNKTLNKNILSIEKNLTFYSKENGEKIKKLLEKYYFFKKNSNNEIYGILCQISSELNISLDQLIKTELNPRELIKKLNHLDYLNPRYLNDCQKLSSVQGMKNVSQFLEKLMDERTLNYLLKEIEISKQYLKNSKERYLSSLIPYDFFKKLSEYGLRDDHFLMMGENTAKNMSPSLKEKLKKEKSFKDQVEKLIFEIIPANYDNLYDYKIIKLSKGSAEIRIKVNDQHYGNFDSTPPTSPELTTYLHGAFKGVLQEASSKVLNSKKTTFTPHHGSRIKLQVHRPQQEAYGAF